MDATPVTKRRKIEEKKKSAVHKLGPGLTFLTLIKGFVASAVLYLPKSFVNGGYGFSIIALIVSAVVTIYCALLLLQVREVTKSSSYSELGLKLYGRVGKVMVDFCLCIS
jgi:proton-coupled amino acid transporter